MHPEQGSKLGVVRAQLTRYWIEFENTGDQMPLGIRLGVGVTGLGREDALDLVRDRVFDGRLPTIQKMIEAVDVSTLDPGHVLPNMGSPADRGIWFPLSYA
jgi:hypothetical protein